MRPSLRLALAAALTLPASSFANPVFTFKPAPDEERPVITELRATPQGADLSLEVLFDRAPFGALCGLRCANATVFIDTDDNPKTGVQFGKNAPETGAELAVVLQGTNDYRTGDGEPYFRVKVRELPNGARALADDAPVLDLDHRKDKARVQVDAETAFVLVDASATGVKWGKKLRLVYHPPARLPVSGKAAGFTTKKGGQVEIIGGGSKKKSR